MLGLRRERRVSHGTQVQWAIKQAQVNNRAFLNSMAAAEARTGTLASEEQGLSNNSPAVYEVADNDAIVALRFGDSMVVIDHPDAKTSELINAVETLVTKASGVKRETPPWNVQVPVGKTGARLTLRMDRDGKPTVMYTRDANATPVPVDPIGRLEWKF